MQVPPFVRRAARRVLLGGAISAVAVALVGAAGERQRFGADAEAARLRLAGDVQARVSDLARRLTAGVGAASQFAGLRTVLDLRDETVTRDLFAHLAAAEAALDVPGMALTVYGPDARPLAWAGRPGPLPTSRVTGPESLFLAPSATGLRLTRVLPVLDPEVPGRRIGTIVGEAPIARAPAAMTSGEFLVPTSVVPVPLRLSFEGEAADRAIAIRDPQGAPLAAIVVPDEDIAAARRQWQRRTQAAGGAVAVVVFLLLIGPLLDWRRATRPVSLHASLTLAVLALLLAARAVAWWAVARAGLDQPRLVLPVPDGPWQLWLASPFDFLLTALAAGGVVALASGSFEQWRQGRHVRVRPLPGTGLAGFVLAQLVAGALVGWLLWTYRDFLHSRLTMMPVEALHFSLHPFDTDRLAVAMGLVALHATLLALAVLIYRVARVRWVIPASRPLLRLLVPVLWVAPAAVLFYLRVREGDGSSPLPIALVVAVAIVAAWHLRRLRARLEHASQASRLAALFVAVALPSLVFYPSLVEAAGRARRQMIEARYAPEVVNQRRNLQLELTEALAQIDALPDLADLVQARDAVAASGPTPYETAFRVWERTVLEDKRLTSSVELHDAAGALVSRFGLKLPHTGGPLIYQEASCQWELFEEVSPFFAEERRLLHAGRGICVDGPTGTEVVGSIAIHVMLDYSNLSFISARSPYMALLRSEPTDAARESPRTEVEFTVYGWSRRPLYMSGRDAWPLPEPVFQDILSSRDPFWARVTRGDDTFDVYFLNDRGGIYALGYRLTSVFGHLITMAELVVLSAATFLLLLAAGFFYGLIAARTPASGRALLREVRASFYRKLFIAFVAAAVVPVLALALVTRAYIATLMQNDLEMEAARTAASASRVVEDAGVLEVTGGGVAEMVNDDLVVWLSRVIAQDVNIFDRGGLIASSERSLFASGLLPRSTEGDVYRAIMLEGRPSYVTREAVGATEYLVAAAPVRVQNREAILTVPLTLRQQEIEAEIDELDRRVLLAAVLFIILGAGIGYSMAERIADPVNRLMKATARIARGDLSARVLTTSSDELRRLVEAFNRMAADLQQQRVELERSNRLAAWADMARQVAHDIKNPLTPIQLNAEHLRRVHQDRGAPLGPVLDDCVSHILQQVHLLRQIASEFSSFASSPSARPSPSPLAALIGEVVQGYRLGLKGRITIVEDVPEALPPVMVDKAVLSRALTNIIENALHAMPGGGTLTIAAREHDAASIALTIGDTGVGMDAEALERIFEPYFSTRASGSGLGLTIAKRNVELNGGTIAVDSQRGHGTTVRITLPRARAVA